MTPSMMEVAGLVVVSGALYQAGHSLLTTFRRRAHVGREQMQALQSFREATQDLLVKARTEQVPEEQSWSGFRKFYIHRRVDEADGIASFYLRPYDGKPVPRYLPGQHLTFRLQIPGRPQPVIRCYSLSEAPVYQNQYRITIKRQGGGAGTPDGIASCYFHDALEPGRIVDVKAPSGNFYLDLTDQRPVVLIAGGVGITPVLSMLNTVCITRSNRETWLFYSVRNRNEHAMADHLRRLVREHRNVKVVNCYTRPTKDCVKGRDYHYRGRINRRLLEGLLPSKNCQFYFCGPTEMQQTVAKELASWGVAKRDFRYESFGGRKKPKAAPAAVPAAETIEVVFARSGKVGKWLPGSDMSLLDVAEAAGVPMDCGCRAGQCGTCMTPIKEGSVEYATEPVATPTPGACLTCVATPKPGLVLDA
jgi:hypothetical protein